jgi:hypothetical protein
LLLSGPFFRDYRREPEKEKRKRKTPFYEGKTGVFEAADDGIRTHTPPSRERILSPLRLPFRHIGGALAGV